MAILKHLSTERELVLPSPCRVGSFADSELRIAAGYVSASHALLSYRGDRWWVRDLNSRNGTFLNGRRLSAEESAELTLGQSVAFGESTDVWQVTEVGPPNLMARADDGTVRYACDGILALPDERTPAATVYMAGRRWVIEHEDDTWTFEGHTDLRIAGRTWRVMCPVSQGDTSPAGRRLPALRDATLRFETNADHSVVSLAVLQKGAVLCVPGVRPYARMLLELALERLADRKRAPPISEAEEGWLDRDVLLERLGLEPEDTNTLNSHKFLAGRELSAHGVRDVMEVVERRPRKPGGHRAIPQRRLGVRSIEVRYTDAPSERTP